MHVLVGYWLEAAERGTRRAVHYLILIMQGADHVAIVRVMCGAELIFTRGFELSLTTCDG